MGLTTSQFLEMDFWQYNAYSQAWKARTRDLLAIEIQGAWLNAYWSGKAKHKKSLNQVLKSLESEDEKEPRKPINKKVAEDTFRQFEEIQKYGWTKV